MHQIIIDRFMKHMRVIRKLMDHPNANEESNSMMFLKECHTAIRCAQVSKIPERFVTEVVNHCKGQAKLLFSKIDSSWTMDKIDFIARGDKFEALGD